jgi:tetratricopeptide (TPR) repeat protein
MARRIATLVLTILATFTGFMARASDTAPTHDEIVDLLSHAQYAALDKRLAAVQSDYDHGGIDDVQLREVFRGFYFTTPTLAKNFDEWVQAFPESYVAHLARGIYYKKVGQERRGDKSSSETSADQFAGMTQALERASADLELSMTLDAKPLLSFLHRINIHQLHGAGSNARVLLDRSIKIDPHNFVVRFAYLTALQTAWGGSTAEMRAFYDESEKAGLTAKQLREMQAMIQEDIAWTARYVDNDPAKAARAYGREAELTPDKGCVVCGPLHKEADTWFNANKYAKAIELYSKVLQQHPDTTSALDNRGFSELQLNQPQAAFEDFTRSANLGDAYAQTMLAKMYLMSTSIPKDRDKGIEWLQKAAKQGYEPAKELLPHALDRNVEILPTPGSRF